MDGLLDLPHAGHTQARFSVNASAHPFEGGTSAVADRLAGAGRMAAAGYPIGLVVAPIMADEGWRERYTALLDQAAERLPATEDLTFELITHRFTPGSREVLTGWYPRTKLDLDPSPRTEKRNRFGGVKHVYPRAVMAELRTWFTAAIEARFGDGRILYWT